MTPNLAREQTTENFDRLLLIGRAQSGDRSALDLLLRSLQDSLYAHVRAIVRDDDDAKDVLQNSLYQIARKLPSLRDPRWLCAWAYRIATREALRRAHADRRWAEALRGDDLSLIPAAERDENFDPEMLAALPGLIDELSPASQAVLRMHYLDGMSLVEIAEALEVAVGTVKSRLAYGLNTLRKRLPATEIKPSREPVAPSRKIPDGGRS